MKEVKGNQKKEFVFVKTDKHNTLGKPLPNSKELEDAVLGAVMLEKYTLNRVIQDFTVNLFFQETNRIIAKAVLQLYADNSDIDILTVVQQLKKSGELDDIGGAWVVTNLTSRVSGTGNIEHHIKILQQNYLERYLADSCTRTINRILNYREDVFDIYSQHQAEIDNALNDVMHYEIKKIGAIHHSTIVESKEISEKGIKSGITVGLKAVDSLTGGWQKQDLIILAGRPSMGKTAAAVSMMVKPAILDNIPVAIFSLEMSAEQLTGRIQSQLSEINVSRIIKKQLTMEEIIRMDEKCLPLLANAPLFIDDTPNISVLELRAKARRLVMEHGVKLIVVDYLQLMSAGVYVGNREQEIAYISRSLKNIAKELDIPVIALSQLSRAVEQKADKKPGLSDLRESGSLEQDADVVVFCYRPEYYGIDNYEVEGVNFETQGLFMFIFAKHRNGELWEVPLRFVGEQTKLENHSYGGNSMTNEIVESVSNTQNTSAIVGNVDNFLKRNPTEDMPF